MVMRDTGWVVASGGSEPCFVRAASVISCDRSSCTRYWQEYPCFE